MKLRRAVPSILLLWAASATGQEPAYVNSIGMEFVRIPAGSFVMGKFQPTCPLEGGKLAWTPEDFAMCRELAKRDARPGFAWGRLNVSLLRGAKDENHLAVCLIEEITDQKQTEKEIRT